MQILLDTTVQIDRMFYKGKKAKIDKIVKENDCYTTSYSIGEFNCNIVRDFVTLYNIMQIENNINDVVDKVNEKVFNRDHKRMIYIINDLGRLYDNDYELIKEELEFYAKRLSRRFMYLLNREIINGTKCNRANAFIKIVDGVATLKNYKCTKKDKFCEICEFWDKHKEELELLNISDNIDEKYLLALKEIQNDKNQAKGNNCRTVGDCVIALESMELNERNILTTNIKDFKPICEALDINIVST